VDPDVTRVPDDDRRRTSTDPSTELGRPGEPAATRLGDPGSDLTGIPSGREIDVTRASSSGTAGTSPHTATTHGPLRTGESFGPRYHIIRELGVGGMGAVYQAWDEELGVAVALKLVRPGAGDPAAARELELRFKRELLLARQVTHKNVVRIHDLGEVDGIKYITMPFVEGSDLAHILEAEGKLPVDRTLAIARQVASGLRAAHDVGIVHRDLKPANIMIEGDTALIMDFGIARSVTGPQSATGAAVSAPPGRPSTGIRAQSPLTAVDAALTIVGGVVGTIQYMAPEQARADAVDHRADLYAFGLIMYDLLVGRHRLAAHENPVNELKARIAARPPALRSIDPSIPVGLVSVVERCLAPDPADRFQTTGDLVAALERLDDAGQVIPEPAPPVTRISRRAVVSTSFAAVAAIALLVGGTFWMARRNTAPTVEPPPVSVLVADFDNSSGDAVFSGLVEQALTVGLEGASFVTAYPRRDALQLAGQIAAGGRLDASTASLIAIREGVTRLVTGSIESADGGYRITASLVDPGESRTIEAWSEVAGRKEAVLEAVGTLAVRVRAGLGDANAGAAEGANESFTAASLDAARAYATGQELQWAGKAEEAIAEYTRAVTLDPDLGRAYSGLGALADSLGRKQEAEEYYKQALARIARMTDRERFRTRGGYYLLTRNADKALEEFQALVAKYPADTAGLANLALAYFYRRDMARAVDVGRRAVEIYPKNVIRRTNLALFTLYASDFEGAVREALEVLELNPAREKAFVTLAMAQAALGRPDDARDTYARLQRVSQNGRSMAAAGLADLALYQGRREEAAELLEGAIEAEPDVSRRRRLTVTLAEVRQAQGRDRDAARLAAESLEGGADPGQTLLAARVLLHAGQAAKAAEHAAALAGRLDIESQMYGGVLQGELALHRNDPRTAIAAFKTAQQVADSWLVREGLARAYLAGEAFPEADSELDACMNRRGEAAAVLLDDVPTVRFLAPLYYHQGRIREGLGSPGAEESYRQFLAIKAGGDERELVIDAQRRIR
jgi:serine/threonine protein kinase/Flp pilus assembly protein TadD